MAIPWTRLARVDTDEGPLELRRRRDDFLITVAGRVLMNSAASRSEEALGRLGCETLAGRPRPRVLVGGLGMGCTLRAALDVLPADARVVVAELNETVVDWCRGPLAELTGGAASDARVEVRIGDVAALIAREAGGEGFDAILLDLFEGPPPGGARARDPHFGARALASTRRALRPGGVFGVWSEDPDPGFERDLRRAGFSVSHQRPGRGGRRHVVYLARAGS